MRRILSVAALVTAVMMGGAACAGDADPTVTGSQAPPGVTATATASPGPTAAVEGATPATGGGATPGAGGPVTGAAADVCAEAKQAIGETLTSVAEQLAKIGAAQGSDAAVQQAVDTVNEKLSATGSKLREYAGKNVPPQVKTAFTQAATELSEVASPSYAGSPDQLRQKLTGVVTTVQGACG